MGALHERKLFVKWVMTTAVCNVLFVALGITYGSKIHGPSLAVIPIILVTYTYAAGVAARICWYASDDLTPVSPKRLLHDAEWLIFYAWVTPMIGIMGTVFGFWKLLAAGGTDADLHARIQAGGGVALVGTFTGVLVSVALTVMHRLIEHELKTKR